MALLLGICGDLNYLPLGTPEKGKAAMGKMLQVTCEQSDQRHEKVAFKLGLTINEQVDLGLNYRPLPTFPPPVTWDILVSLYLTNDFDQVDRWREHQILFINRVLL